MTHCYELTVTTESDTVGTVVPQSLDFVGPAISSLLLKCTDARRLTSDPHMSAVPQMPRDSVLVTFLLLWQDTMTKGHL